MSETTKRRCPTCGNAIKGHPNKRFCGSKCKDRYHNKHNPRGYHAYRVDDGGHPVEFDADDAEHPFSSEALGQF